ncbi:hypothetical protein SDC9_172862 [bioreactor metagenome]|uniref:Uncharacterized protein n=1 Tax=bioreactor metagenome TaxID=1076179 RepID=A0A645GP29_9ZZZZ
MLMDHTDAHMDRIFGGGKYDLCPLNEYMTAVRAVNSRQHIDKRAFARSVLAQQCMDLPFVEFYGDILVGDDTAEGFCDILQPDIRSIAHIFPPFLKLPYYDRTNRNIRKNIKGFSYNIRKVMIDSF